MADNLAAGLPVDSPFFVLYNPFRNAQTLVRFPAMTTRVDSATALLSVLQELQRLGELTSRVNQGVPGLTVLAGELAAGTSLSSNRSTSSNVVMEDIARTSLYPGILGRELSGVR